MYKTEQEVIEAFNKLLNDVISLGQIQYTPADVLKAIDPLVYREELLDYADSLARDGLLPEEWEDWGFEV